MQRLVNGTEWEVSRLDTFILCYEIGRELEEGEKYIFTVRKIEHPFYNVEERGPILFQRVITDVKNEDGKSYFTILATKKEAQSIPIGEHKWDLAVISDTSEQAEALIRPQRFEVLEVMRDE